MDSKGRKREEKVDVLSKIIDIDDWGNSFAFFNFDNNMWGVHTIHRFANMNNTKLPRYNSLYWDHRTSAIDAFTSNWREENNWMVLPINLVSKCINHLVSCKVVGTLIVPKYPEGGILTSVV
jgi:hypothetical protein